MKKEHMKLTGKGIYVMALNFFVAAQSQPLLFEAYPRIIDFSFLAEELINLVEDEKIFKRGVKKGYKCLARNNMGTCVQYPNNWSIEEVRKDMEKEGLTTLYTELKDFIHII